MGELHVGSHSALSLSMSGEPFQDRNEIVLPLPLL
jgi:hypothetical protein